MYDLNQTEQTRPITLFSTPVEPPNPAAEFGARLARFTPVIFFTPAIVAINVLVFLVMVVSGVRAFGPASDSLIRWGANFGPNTVTGGEWWRLLTSTFIHIGILHLAFNIFVLMQIGPFLERLLGNAAFAIVYLLCGVAGSMASVARNPYAVSAGASGAIFGVYGALLGFICLRKDSIPREVLWGLTKGALLFLVYNFIYGATRLDVDLAGHAGGLAAGLLCGFAMSNPLTDDSVQHRFARASVVAVASTAIMAVLAGHLPRPADIRTELHNFAVVEKKTLAAYNAALTTAKTQPMPDQFAATLERDVIPQWRTAHDSLAKFAKEPRLPVQQKLALARLLEYVETRQKGWSLLVQGVRGHDTRMVRQASETQQYADRLVEKMAPRKQ